MAQIEDSSGTQNQELICNLPHDLFFAIEVSKMRRLEKIKCLNPADELKLIKIEEALNDAELLYMRHAKTANKYYQPTKGGFQGWNKKSGIEVNKEFYDDYKATELELMEWKSSFEKICDIDFSFSAVTKQVELNVTYEQLCFEKEKLLNKWLNENIYMHDVNHFFSINKQMIFKHITNLNFLDCSTCEIERIELISPGAETHNKGKKPVFLHLKDNKENKATLVCKPRNAGIDLCIINLFL